MQVQRLTYRVMYGAIGLWVAIASSGFAPVVPWSAFSGSDQLAIAQDTLGTLPVAIANAVMADAQERLNAPERMGETTLETPVEVGIRLESVEPVTWNECGGGTGPSQPMRGTCPNAEVSGWRMVVASAGRSEPLRLVYYIPQGAEVGAEVGSWMPQPDGLQSLSEAAQRQILAKVAEDAGVPMTSLRLFWVDARFFDRCLDTRPEAPSCGLGSRPGWAVQILVDQTIPGTPIQQPLWVYHTNITGTDVRLVGQGRWMPPP